MATNDTSVNFESDVLESEHHSINSRRRELGKVAVEVLGKDEKNPKYGLVYKTVGLSLSGGGIRSAAIGLGVLQALDRYRVLDSIDYLSTVSGGGYVGSSLTATMTATSGKFVFNEQAALATAARQVDSLAVAHLRNHSNYLLAGKQNLGSVIAIFVRGVIANFAIVAPIILYCSALFAFSVVLLRNFRIGPFSPSGTTVFLVQICFAVGVVLFLVWSVYLSFRPARALSEESSHLPAIAAVYLVFLALVIFLAIQIPMIWFMLSPNPPEYFASTSEFYFLLHLLAIGSIPLGIAVAVIQRPLGDALNKQGRGADEIRVWVIAAAARLAIWLSALALPLLLWVSFLHLTSFAVDDLASFGDTGGLFGHSVPWLYCVAATVLLLFAILLKPNAMSLHGLYRDRLKKAFLFDPARPEAGSGGFAPLSEMRLSDISCAHAPYHLINAALNIHGSSYANQRGRDADFFLFSPNYVGSSVTGYVPTVAFEKAQQDFDLAAAVAISGAAVSSSMGAKSIRILAPTLAMLNIRLGYWLRNPRRLFQSIPWTHVLTRSIHSFWAEARGKRSLCNRRWPH